LSFLATASSPATAAWADTAADLDLRPNGGSFNLKELYSAVTRSNLFEYRDSALAIWAALIGRRSLHRLWQVLVWFAPHHRLRGFGKRAGKIKPGLIEFQISDFRLPTSNFARVKNRRLQIKRGSIYKDRDLRLFEEESNGHHFI
jgi:hypothetical protein